MYSIFIVIKVIKCHPDDNLNGYFFHSSFPMNNMKKKLLKNCKILVNMCEKWYNVVSLKNIQGIKVP